MRGDVVQFYWFVGWWVGRLRRKIQIKQRGAMLGSGGDSTLLALLEGNAGRDGVGQQIHVTNDFIRGRRRAENHPRQLRAKCHKKRSLSRRNIALAVCQRLPTCRRMHARTDASSSALRGSSSTVTASNDDFSSGSSVCRCFLLERREEEGRDARRLQHAASSCNSSAQENVTASPRCWPALKLSITADITRNAGVLD